MASRWKCQTQASGNPSEGTGTNKYPDEKTLAESIIGRLDRLKHHTGHGDAYANKFSPALFTLRRSLASRLKQALYRNVDSKHLRLHT